MAKPLVVCGGVLLVALVAAARVDARAETIWFLCLMGVAAGTYLATLYLIARRPPGSSRELATCLLLAVVWRVAFVAAAPLVSDDVYRYIWDGRVQRLGYNPYESAPDDPTLSHVHTALTRQIDPTSAELPTIYPPATELFFRGVTAVHESVAAVVLAIVICDLLTVWVLWHWLRAIGKNPWWVLAYAWHPLVALEGAGGAHIDVLGTLLVVCAAYALFARRGLVASLALALAFSVKFLPVVLIPLLWRRVRVRDALVAVGVVVALYLPFSDGTLSLPVGSLGVYAEQWRFNGPFFEWLEVLAGSVGALGLAVAGGLAIAVVARLRLPGDAPEAWAWPMATALLLMPAVYPWYLVWLTPFLVTRHTWPLVAWTLASLLTYVVWVSQLSGVGWVLPAWVEPVEYSLVAGVGVWVWIIARRLEPFRPA